MLQEKWLKKSENGRVGLFDLHFGDIAGRKT